MVRGETDVSNLVLELRPGETMVVNGASIRFRTKSRLELTAHARFLFGKQIMPPGGDNTPARRIYYAIQTAYIGTEEERGPARAAAQRLCDEFAQATTSRTVVHILTEAMRAVEQDRCYAALKLVYRVMRHEDTVLNVQVPVAEQDAA